MTALDKARKVQEELDWCEESLTVTAGLALGGGDGVAVEVLTALRACEEASRGNRAHIAALRSGMTAEELLVSQGIPQDYASLAIGRKS